MTLIVKTARLSYGGPDRLDITRSGVSKAIKAGTVSEGEPFAPSWKLLNWGKHMRGIADKKRVNGDAAASGFEDWAWQTYGQRYHMQMRLSYRAHRDAWDKLIARERVVLVCFCTNPKRCHRRLLAEYLEKMGAHDSGEIE